MKKNLFLAAIFLGLGLVVAATASELQRSTHQLTSITISFHRLVPDAEVQSLLEANHALAFAIFTCGGDLCGVYRVAQSQASVNLVIAAREKAVEMEDNAERGLAGRAASLIHDRSEQDFEVSSDLIGQGQNLLKVANSVEVLKTRAADGDAIIYGMQALVSREDAERLMNTPGITAELAGFELTKGGLRMVPPVPERPTESALNSGREKAVVPVNSIYEELSRLSVKY
jgi:hypothetical protein